MKLSLLLIYFISLYSRVFFYFMMTDSVLRCPGRRRAVLPGAGQSRRLDGGPEEEEEDHLQPSAAVGAGAGLRCDSLPGHHPEGEAGRAHTPAREQDTGAAQQTPQKPSFGFY